MYDLISIGNITVDLFFRGESLTEEKDRFHLAIGGKYLADHFYESLGGGGANVAAGAAHLGLNTALIGKIGEGVFKQIIIQKLVRTGVSTEFLLFEKDYVNISSILLSKNGGTTIVHYATKNEHLEISDIAKSRLGTSELVYLGNMPEVPISEKAKILEFFRHKGMKTAINFGVADCRAENAQTDKLLRHADILILNTHEFSELIKKEFNSIDFGADCTKYLSEDLNFGKKLLVLTDGHNGSYLYFGGITHHEKAIEPKKIVDSTGAGDGFTSGFLAGYIKTQDPISSMKKGAEYAAKILEKIGAQ